MKSTDPNTYRPTLSSVIGIFAVIAALQVFNVLTHDDVLTAVVTILVCGTCIAWYFWNNRYS
jgi:hypothetical protein